MRCGGPTDRVNDLMNHDLRKFKLFMFTSMLSAMSYVLRDHRHAVRVTLEALPATPIHMPILIHWRVGIIIIQRRDARRLANASVSPRSGTVVFPPEIERLQEQHRRHAYRSGQQENNLNEALPAEELLLDVAWLQEHVDEHVEQ